MKIVTGMYVRGLVDDEDQYRSVMVDIDDLIATGIIDDNIPLSSDQFFDAAVDFLSNVYNVEEAKIDQVFYAVPLEI